jgi:hypothetical protein
MSWKIVKKIVISVIFLLGVASIYSSWKLKDKYENSITQTEHAKIESKLNNILRSGCKRIYSDFIFEKDMNFYHMLLDNLDLNGSVINLKISNNLFLRELNIEERKFNIGFKAFFIEDTKEKKCFGMVF